MGSSYTHKHVRNMFRVVKYRVTSSPWSAHTQRVITALTHSHTQVTFNGPVGGWGVVCSHFPNNYLHNRDVIVSKWGSESRWSSCCGTGGLQATDAAKCVNKRPAETQNSSLLFLKLHIHSEFIVKKINKTTDKLVWSYDWFDLDLSG